MSDLSRKTASIYINHSSAEEALKSLQKQADILQQKIKKGADAGKNMVGEIAKLNKVQDSIKGVQHQIDNGLRPSFNQLQTTVSRLRNELKRMSEDAPGYAEKFKAFNKASTELDRLSTSINKVKASSGGLKDILSSALPVLGITAAISAVKGFIDEALDAELASSRLANKLDNMGADGGTFDRLARKADDMANRFKFIDNDDVIGVFEQLITYGKLTEQQMNELLPVIIDFAAKSRISLAESTSTIVKALEGNGKALKEYGINIKDAGTEGERLNVIMTTLKGKVEGAADAFGNNTQGNIARTKQEFKDIKEELGTGLLPVLNGVLNFINKGVKGLGALASGLKQAFSGESGFRAVAEYQVANFSIHQQTIKDQADQYLNSYTTTGAQVDKKFGKKKGDATRASILQNLKDQLHQDNIDYAEMAKDGQESLQNLRDFKMAIMARQMAIDNITALTSDLSGGSNTGGGGKVSADGAAKKALEDFKKLQDEINSLLKTIKDNYNKETLTQFQYQILQIEMDFETNMAKLKEANKDKELLSDERFYDSKIQLLITKLNKINDLYAKNPDNPLVKKTAPSAQLASRSTPEIDAAVLIEELKGNATKKVRDRITAEQVVEQAKNAAALYDAFSSIQNNKDQAAIAAKNAQADKERNAAKRQLDAKLIDQATYDAKIKTINDKNNKAVEAIEKKQFERQKRMQIIQAVINGAEGITATIAKNGMPAAIPFIAITAAITGAQIAAIASQKYIPKYARGGVFDGPGHNQGGMPVVNPRTGRKVAELEGGEPILSRRTYANNKSIVDALLHSSMYNGGATIIPGWQQRSYSGINWGMVNNRVQQVRRFERGGVFTASGSTVTDNGELSSILKQLFTVLSQPIKTYTLYSEQNAAAELDAKVKAATTFSRN